MGRFLSHWHAAESLSPAGSYNYSSSVLAADTRAIFRFAKMTLPLTGTYAFGVVTGSTPWFGKEDKQHTYGLCVHS